jgi:hypothetical protein
MAPRCCSRAHMPSDAKGRRVRAGGREAHEREGATGGGSPGDGVKGEDWGGEHGRGLGRGEGQRRGRGLGETSRGSLAPSERDKGEGGTGGERWEAEAR